MIPDRRVGRYTGSLLLLLGLFVTTPLRAQNRRDSLVAAASAAFDATHRVGLLVSALDPALGRPGPSWTTGVGLLAQTLVEEGKQTVADAWLRWALRVAPDFQPDTVQLLPRVIAAYGAARGLVERTRSPQDSLATTKWRWPAGDNIESVGGLIVTATAVAVPVSVVVIGVGQIAVGERVPLPPGSYAIRAQASGYDSVQVTRETLPGVTTVVELHLPPVMARPLVAAEAPPAEVPPVVPPPTELEHGRGGRFPWLVVGLGAVGVGALVAILAGGSNGGGGGGGGTGGIIITFPNP
jgi:hypothetical protein